MALSTTLPSNASPSIATATFDTSDSAPSPDGSHHHATDHAAPIAQQFVATTVAHSRQTETVMDFDMAPAIAAAITAVALHPTTVSMTTIMGVLSWLLDLALSRGCIGSSQAG